MIGISSKDKYLIKSLRENKKYGAKWLLKMFPNKNWSLGGLKALIKLDGFIVWNAHNTVTRQRSASNIHGSGMLCKNR